MTTRPTLFIVLEGGMITSICSDQPGQVDLHDIVTIDYDTDGADPEELGRVEQSDGEFEPAHVHHWGIEKVNLGQIIGNSTREAQP